MKDLTEQDIEIIKEFIDNYETVEKNFEKYKAIKQSINKNMLFQKYKYENEFEIKYNRTQVLNEIENQTDKNLQKLLLELMKTLEQDINALEKYKQIKIEEKYQEMYSGNLSKYFKPKEEPIIEPPTKIYKPKDELLDKDYYYNEKTTIIKIYERVKYLYDYYNNDGNYFLDPRLEKNKEFFRKFKGPIYKYNESNKEIISFLTTKENSENEKKQKSK